jgi:nucleoside-diphosphate-sugar epimerase
MRRVLVTGAAGRIGSAVVAELLGRGVEVIALVLPGTAAPAPGVRLVKGDVSDPVSCQEALAGADGVVHLAARPAPHRGTPYEVFGGNTLATFTLLEGAGVAGVRNAVLASSYAANGLPFASRRRSPDYVPVDERLPNQAEDPYALSKLTDELTAAMMARRHGMNVIALRYPFVGGLEDRLLPRARQLAADPAAGAADLWSYLDTRDAARAAVLALEVTGTHVLHVAAPRTLAPYPTLELLQRFHPATEIRADLPGRTTPLDLSAAERLLGFTAEHEVELSQT